MDAAFDLATHIASKTSLVVGTDLFCAPMPPAEIGIPDSCVALIETGGNPPEPYLGGQRSYLEATIQVRIRGPKEDYQAAKLLAQSVWNAINLAQIANYVSVACDESVPHYQGPDQGQRHMYSLNVTMGFHG